MNKYVIEKYCILYYSVLFWCVATSNVNIKNSTYRKVPVTRNLGIRNSIYFLSLLFITGHFITSYCVRLYIPLIEWLKGIGLTGKTNVYNSTGYSEVATVWGYLLQLFLRISFKQTETTFIRGSMSAHLCRKTGLCLNCYKVSPCSFVHYWLSHWHLYTGGNDSSVGAYPYDTSEETSFMGRSNSECTEMQEICRGKLQNSRIRRELSSSLSTKFYSSNAHTTSDRFDMCRLSFISLDWTVKPLTEWTCLEFWIVKPASVKWKVSSRIFPASITIQ